MNGKKLRGVCIGAGYFSHFQYEAWQRIPEVEIVAFSNRDATRAQVITDKFGLRNCYPDFREMFDREQPDFVDIITPPPSHSELCAEASKRGIHIICQKPLAPTFAEAEAIVVDAAKADVRFMMHENFRFQPWHREIKRLIQEGAIGDRLHSLSFRTRTGDGWGEQAYIPRQPYFREYPRFLVYEMGGHFIDTFRYLAGEIRRVSAWLRRLNPVIKGEDCGLLVFEFENGAIGQWDANRYNEPVSGTNARYTFGELLVEGSGGGLRLHLDGGITLQKIAGEDQPVYYKHYPRGFAGDCVYTTQRHFIDRLQDGKPFETSGEDYLRTITVLDAAYRSAETHKTVEIPSLK
ncbi:MAG TPA: Gfo/Idh/MocA family oxidoreductase [Planctomycetes bacterium]|nr:Gfo/Idh/MocA family oxidoreductase [Verrucomicrobiales bacterium]HIM31308.1 Gfo/Idh/MocA family oxidoreductase [Planctomycetota bacterium]